jgi:hypothetical protein
VNPGGEAGSRAPDSPRQARVRVTDAALIEVEGLNVVDGRQLTGSYLTTIVARPALRERQTAMHVAPFRSCSAPFAGIIGLCHSYRSLLHF